MAGQRIELPPYSMYVDTPVYQVGEDLVFGLLRDAVIPDGSDQIYVVPSAAEGRLDLIANHFYATPHLWWVIARVNEINDALVGPRTGDQLQIPTRERLISLGLLTA